MGGRSPKWVGPATVATLTLLSLFVAAHDVWFGGEPIPSTLRGHWSLIALVALFGAVGYYTLTNVEAPNDRAIVGVYAGVGYVLAGLASGYSLYQQVAPSSDLGLEVVLDQMTFVALVAAAAGALVGLEKARRKRSIADLESTATELEASQAAVRTEKRRFESLFQNAPSAVADIRYRDGEPTVVRANAVFEDLLDETTTDAAGKNPFEVVPVRETETEARVVAHVANNEIYEDEVTVDRSDERSHYKLRVIPYEVGKEGERAFALYTDVTELRRTQQELAESVDRLEASNERLEQFAYAVSHDLREPLRMISSHLELLEERYGDDLDEDAAEFIDFAVDGADRMRAMIDSLLDYSRVATRGEPLVPTDSEGVLDDVLTDLGPQIEETDATVTTDDLPTVTADPDQLGQVFRNLVSNALKYSGDDPPRVHVGAEREGDEWRFAVDDQGIGIGAEQRERVFDVFETAHTDEEGSESGIGLALCQRIVERHDGDIWVESASGEGSTFYFTIPAAEDEQGPLSQQPAEDDERTCDSAR